MLTKDLLQEKLQNLTVVELLCPALKNIEEKTWHRGRGCTADKVYILAKILVLLAARLS